MTAPILLVMLPGAGFGADDYAAHGFTNQLNADRVRPVVADVPEGRYLEGDVALWLHETCIAPAMAQGFERLWLMGISLGGMGALLSLRAGLSPVAGLLLLSPFLGTRGSIAAVAAAGGLAAWQPPPAGPHDVELGLLAWLRGRDLTDPPVHLGCGQADRYAPASRILARALPPARSRFIDGGHDWPTWTRLWTAMLADDPFAP